MKRWLAPVLIVASIIVAATALILNARGSDDDDNAVAAADVADSTAPADSSQPASTPTVDTTGIDGLGRAHRRRRQRAVCLRRGGRRPGRRLHRRLREFWIPVDAGSATPTGADGITGLDVAGRPDGTMQVTLDGRRLYTFSLDSPARRAGRILRHVRRTAVHLACRRRRRVGRSGHERHHDGDRRRQRRLPGY